MKRKEFLTTSSLAVAGSILSPLSSCSPKEKTNAVSDAAAPRTNWAGNYTYKAPQLHEPTTIDELQALVKKLNSQKALGSTHCFNNIADSPQNQISTAKLNGVKALDPETQTITIGAGSRYGNFAEELHAQGFALHNLASLPHITVAGACSTATHGSGVGNGNLATAVRSLQMVTPNGEVVEMDRSHSDFAAVVVGLGSFGIITEMTLDIQPTFDVRQDVFLDLPLSSLVENFDDIMSAGYSVSLFTDWMNQNVSEVWVKRRTDLPADDLGNDFYGATAATKNIHPIIELSAEHCTDQMGVPGPWYDRLPHFKMGFTPSAGDELQAEYFVPRTDAVEAILAVEAIKDEVNPQLMITEIRTIAADSFWMSPCYQQDSVAIHFTLKPNKEGVMALLPKIESALAPFGVKPHWGKLFTLDPQVLQSRYEKYQDFLALAKSYDLEGKFRNAYLDRNIY